MANRYAVANFTVGVGPNPDYVWVGSVRDSASATVIAYPAGFSVTPTVSAGTLKGLSDYLVVRPAGP